MCECHSSSEITFIIRFVTQGVTRYRTLTDQLPYVPSIGQNLHPFINKSDVNFEFLFFNQHLGPKNYIHVHCVLLKEFCLEPYPGKGYIGHLAMFTIIFEKDTDILFQQAFLNVINSLTLNGKMH